MSDKKPLQINIPSRVQDKPKNYSERVQPLEEKVGEAQQEGTTISESYPDFYPMRTQPTEDLSDSTIVTKLDQTNYPPDNYPVGMWSRIVRLLKNKVYSALQLLQSDVDSLGSRVTILETTGGGGSGSISDIIPIENGGTGRDDGASQDVVLYGNITAKTNGQIGDCKVIISDTDLNTVTKKGFYILQKNMTIATNNLPENSGNNTTFMNVYAQGIYIIQEWELLHRKWQRRSVDSGNTWQWWYPIGGFQSAIIIYISKSGSDANTGLSSSYPVITFDRAFQIADVFARGASNVAVYFRVGTGDWGNLIIADKPYNIIITPYEGQTPTAYSSSLPMFGDLQIFDSRVTVTGLIIGYLRAYNSAVITVTNGYKRICWCNLVYGGTIIFNSGDENNVMEMNNEGHTAYIRGGFEVNGGMLIINNVKINITSALSHTNFLSISDLGRVEWRAGLVTLVDGGSFTGKKYTIYSGGILNGSDTVGKPAFLDNLPGTQAGVDYPGSVYNGIPKGLLSSVASLYEEPKEIKLTIV